MAIFNPEKMVKATDFEGRCKATVQASGKLGFSSNGAKALNLKGDSAVLISEMDNGNLAVVVLQESAHQDSFEVNKIGEYYNINLKAFFDKTNVPYADKAVRVIYDIVETDEVYEGNPVFKFSRRIRPRTSKDIGNGE